MIIDIIKGFPAHVVIPPDAADRWAYDKELQDEVRRHVAYLRLRNPSAAQRCYSVGTISGHIVGTLEFNP